MDFTTAGIPLRRLQLYDDGLQFQICITMHGIQSWGLYELIRPFLRMRLLTCMNSDDPRYLQPSKTPVGSKHRQQNQSWQSIVTIFTDPLQPSFG